MYYNAKATMKTNSGHVLREFWFDLTRDQMESQLAYPFRNGRPIFKNGKVWAANYVREIQISRNSKTSKELRAIYMQNKADRSTRGLAEEAYIIREGEDVTEEMLREPVSATVVSANSMVDSIGIRESLVRFREDWPDPTKVAFVMMQFGKTKAHENITTAIREVLGSHSIEGLRADNKEYNDNLFLNIQTYAHGCGFGIAVFERIEQEAFNPNVSLEVGYMLGLGKPVCLLKDKTLTALHTDLVGKLYKPFDPQDPFATIPAEITKWLSDKGIC